MQFSVLVCICYRAKSLSEVEIKKVFQERTDLDWGLAVNCHFVIVINNV
jgi:hypothetical protein